MPLVNFYSCGKSGERTRTHFPEGTWIGKFGLSGEANYAFAVVKGAPMRVLITDDFEIRGESYIAYDSSGVEWPGAQVIRSHGDKRPSFRIERKKDVGTYPLPVDWQGEYRIVKKWPGGILLELTFNAPAFKRAPIQQGLAL